MAGTMATITSMVTVGVGASVEEVEEDSMEWEAVAEAGVAMEAIASQRYFKCTS